MRKKQKVKNRFLKPKTGLKPKGPVKQIGHAGIRFHQGFVRDRLRHTVLTCKQISKVDLDMIAATLKVINTGPDAQTLPDGINRWECVVSHDKRSLTLKYKGFEVALFYHRQLTEIHLQPGDRFPEGTMQDPTEAWVKFDLIGRSAKQKNIVLVNVHQRLEEENKVLTWRVDNLRESRDKLEKQYNELLEWKQDHESNYNCNRKKKRRKR